MPWTRSLLELPGSPFEQGSQQSNMTYSIDLTNYLAGGTINSLAVKVWGGPLYAGDVNWTDQTSTLNASVSLSGNKAQVLLANALTAAWGYRVELTWLTASSNGQKLERFFILRVLY